MRLNQELQAKRQEIITLADGCGALNLKLTFFLLSELVNLYDTPGVVD